MCRLVGVVSNETASFRFSLRDAPRSLHHLSREHPHGWGLAVHAEGSGWDIHKHAACAGEDERFDALAGNACGELLLAHVRKRTAGTISLENTHPFRSGRWVFAHNGTIEDLAYLVTRTSPERKGALSGDTDSERYFAFLLSVIDRAEHEGASIDAALADALSAARARPALGAANFLLSDGHVMYAHRFGRTLHLMERAPADRVRLSRHSSETGATVETAWTARRHAIFVASERLTDDEPWIELEEGALIRIDGGACPTWRHIEATNALSSTVARTEWHAP